MALSSTNYMHYHKVMIDEKMSETIFRIDNFDESMIIDSGMVAVDRNVVKDHLRSCIDEYKKRKGDRKSKMGDERLEEDRNKALAKLSDYDRKILGL